jgi:Xaa-Pro aminopeptidase
MERRGLTHLAVYGDREHFANMAWLAGFDPRFEEALLLVGLEGKPLLLAGNESMGYLQASPAVAAGQVRVERWQWLSLPSQPRESSRELEEILRDERLDAHCRVGVAGWKDYPKPEQTDLPSYLADAMRFACGWENVRSAAGLFTDPDDGLRTVADAGEIAFFEWTNTLAAEGMRRVIEAVRPGAMDYELLEEARYCGVPLACHMTLKCGGNRASLASARGERVARGGRLSCGIAYWGANCCRCGWVAEGPGDLPPEAQGYVERFAGPYFEAMGAWFGGLRIGGTGGALHEAVAGRLPAELFQVLLNAGHLIHLDEWVSSPVWAGSEARLRSGMVMQADVIPSHAGFYSSRMEDGYVLADGALRAELAEAHPDVLARCEARREFLRTTLGLPVGDDVLPLGNLCGMVPPYLLEPRKVLAIS